MAQQGPFDNDNSQFVVSHELLLLFKWLFEHEQETLKKLVSKSLRNGLDKNLVYAQDFDNPEELQQSIVDFFALMETLLYESINEAEVKKVVQRSLIPALDHIDSKAGMRLLCTTFLTSASLIDSYNNVSMSAKKPHTSS